MTCTICPAPAEADLCPRCAGKLVRVKPARRLDVDRAARRTARILAASQGAIDAPALAESIAVGESAGRRW